MGERSGEVSGDRRAKAMKIRRALGIYGAGGMSGINELREISPAHAQAIVDCCYGVCWNQPLLDLRTREFLIVAAAAAQDLPAEMEWHAEGLLNQGVSPEELIEGIVQLGAYIGFPKTNHALKAAKRAIDKKAPGWRNKA